MLRRCSSDAVCATTPSFSRSSTVRFPLNRALGSPERSTTTRPALLSVQVGTRHTGPASLLDDDEDDDLPLDADRDDFIDDLDDLFASAVLDLPLGCCCGCGAAGFARLLGPGRSRRGEQLEQRADVGAVGTHDRVALVDEGEEHALAQLGPTSLAAVKDDGQQRHGRRAEREAVHAAEAARQRAQLARGRGRDRHHVRVQQRGDGAAGAVARDEQRVAAPRRVLLEQLAQARRHGPHHGACGGQEAGVAAVTSSSRKPRGGTGELLRLTAQSMKVAVPRMAKTMTDRSSTATDLMVMALVPRTASRPSRAPPAPRRAGLS